MIAYQTTSLQEWLPSTCNCVDLDINTRYAPLSHCWEELPIFKLTIAHLRSLQTRIEIQDLSRTFQDTLQVLAYLGLELLWIDSLCIVQDDPNDWNREYVLISSVYGYSDITIAAASSTDVSQGTGERRLSNNSCMLPSWTPMAARYIHSLIRRTQILSKLAGSLHQL